MKNIFGRKKPSGKDTQHGNPLDKKHRKMCALCLEFRQETKDKIEEIRSMCDRFKRLVKTKEKIDDEIIESFKAIAEKMAEVVGEDGKYYPDTLPHNITAVASHHAGPVFNNLFSSVNGLETLQRTAAASISKGSG